MKTKTAFSRMAFCAIVAFWFTNSLMAQTSYILNGNCESKTAWTFGLKTATSCAVSYENGAGNDGSVAVKCVATMSASNKFCVLILSDSIFIPNQVETKLSFWAKSSVANGRILPTTQAVTSSKLPDGVTQFPYYDISDELVPLEWKRYEFTYTTINTVGYYSQVKFRNYISGTLWIDNVAWGDASASGVSSAKASKVNLYQDLSSEMVYIDGVEDQTTLKVYNASGTLVAKGRGTKIDVSSLVAGYYILVPDDNAGVSFIKK
ncbi:MAG: T9SS type A sorting domain-containing protein [Bacteroidales bacterium]